MANSMNDLNQLLKINESCGKTVNVNTVTGKYAPYMEAMKQVYGNTVDEARFAKTALLMENISNYVDNTRVGGMFGRKLNESATQDADVSGFKKFAFDLLSCVEPNLIAEDICSVQPIKKMVA